MKTPFKRRVRGPEMLPDSMCARFERDLSPLFDSIPEVPEYDPFSHLADLAASAHASGIAGSSQFSEAVRILPEDTQLILRLLTGARSRQITHSSKGEDLPSEVEMYEGDTFERSTRNRLNDTSFQAGTAFIRVGTFPVADAAERRLALIYHQKHRDGIELATHVPLPFTMLNEPLFTLEVQLPKAISPK